MGHEISQFDIPNRQLLATNAQPGADVWTDIGEAKISHSFFGGAKVRVIREQDKKRRTWLLTALAVLVLAAAAWQGWVELQQSELLAPPLPLSERIKVSPPVFQPEDTAPSAASPSARNRQKTPTEIVLDSMATRRPPPPPPPQKPLGLKASGQIAANPVTAQPSTASKPLVAKPQAAPFAANNNAPRNQTGMQQSTQLSAPPAAPADATPPATQPAANTPAAVALPAQPSIKEGTSTPSPAGNNQPTDPVKAQP